MIQRGVDITCTNCYVSIIRKQFKVRFIARLIRSYVRQSGSACVTSPCVEHTRKHTVAKDAPGVAATEVTARQPPAELTYYEALCQPGASNVNAFAEKKQKTELSIFTLNQENSKISQETVHQHDFFTKEIVPS